MNGVSVESSYSTDNSNDNNDTKDLKQQNEKLRDAIFQLKSLVKKVEMKNLTLESQINELKEENDDCAIIIVELENDKTDLIRKINIVEEERDALLQAEKIIQNLTEKNMKLEDKLEKVYEESKEFDDICRIMIESGELYKENERNLKIDIEALEFTCMNLKNEIQKRDQILQESESQIIKYKRKITELNEEIQERDDHLLRLQEKLMNLPADGSKQSNLELLNNKRSFADIVRGEYNHLKYKFSKEEVNHLSSFLPENFTKSGGDKDLLSVCLSFPRISAKSNLLMELIIKRYPEVPGGMRKEHVTQSHRAEQMSFVDRFIYSLQTLLTIVNKLESISQQTTLERMSKLALQEPEVAKHEKFIDNYFELLRTGTLDENTSIKDIERCTLYFYKMCSIYYSEDEYDTNQFGHNIIGQFRFGFKWMRKDVQRIELSIIISEAEVTDNQLLNSMSEVSEIIDEIDVLMLRANNAMPKEDKQLIITNDFTDNFLSSTSEFDKVTRSLNEASSVIASQLSIQTENDGLFTSDVIEILSSAVGKVYSNNNSNDPTICIIESLIIIKTFFEKFVENIDSGLLAKQKTEKKIETPVIARAQMRREDADKAESVKWDLKKKEDEIEKLNKVIKQKLDDIGAMKVRLALAEQRLSETTNNKTAGQAEQQLLKLQDEYNEMKEKYDQLIEEKDLRIAELEEHVDAMKGINKNATIHRIMDFGVPSTFDDDSKIRYEEANKRMAVLLMELQKAKYNKMNKELLDLPKINIPNVASGPNSVSLMVEKKKNIDSLITEARKLQKEYPKILIEPVNAQNKSAYAKTLTDFNRKVETLYCKAYKQYPVL